MKVLITGANGQLGSQIYRILETGVSELGQIDYQYKHAEIIALDSEKLDITSVDSVKKSLFEIKPSIVINAAAYTKVDDCEENYELAFKVNSLGARNLAMACETIGAKLIHISTDYIFSGDGTVPYKEFDTPVPVSVYGKTKLMGEEYVKDFCSRYFIIRTAWLYGYNGKNFVKTIMKAGREKGYLEVVEDQRGNPTNVEDLAYHILKLALTEEYGIYHCTGKGECSWYDFACKILEYSKINCIVTPIRSDKLTRAAKRPSYSSLDNIMLRYTVGDEMREWREALKHFILKARDIDI